MVKLLVPYHNFNHLPTHPDIPAAQCVLYPSSQSAQYGRGDQAHYLP